MTVMRMASQGRHLLPNGNGIKDIGETKLEKAQENQGAPFKSRGKGFPK